MAASPREHTLSHEADHLRRYLRLKEFRRPVFAHNVPRLVASA